MKKLLLMVGMLLCGYAANAVEALIVTPTSGQAVVFLFDEKPEVSFLAGKLQVKTTQTGEPAQFDLDDIESISFSGSSGVDDITAGSDGIYCVGTGDGVEFRNIPAGTPAAVYGADGRQVLATTASESLTLSRSANGKGIYIVKIGTFTAKIAL